MYTLLPDGKKCIKKALTLPKTSWTLISTGWVLKEKKKRKNYAGTKLILNTSFIGRNLKTNHNSSWTEQNPAIKEMPKQPTSQTILSVN